MVFFLSGIKPNYHKALGCADRVRCNTRAPRSSGTTAGVGFIYVAGCKHTCVCKFRLHDLDPDLDKECSLEIDPISYPHKTSRASKSLFLKRLNILDVGAPVAHSDKKQS